MAEQQLSVGIGGGGTGGLTAALCLLRAGFDVHVYEQARALSEVGAGIQVSPNASRVMHGLGLSDELAKLGVRPLAWHQRRWDDGRTLLRTPLGDAVIEAFGFPHYQMHRADLLVTLVRALPEGRVHLGRRLTALVDHGGRVEARFEDGTHAESDLLVGADGGSSTSSPSSTRTPGSASRGPIAARSPTRSPPTRAGTRRCARPRAGRQPRPAKMGFEFPIALPLFPTFG